MARPDIEAIAARADAATKGPWEQDVTYIVAMVPHGRPGGEVIGCAHPSGPDLRGLPAAQRVANAAFIAHAREDVPDLLAHIADLEARQKAILAMYAKEGEQ